MAQLMVHFHNMCVFAQGDTRAEVWFLKSAYHRPYMDVSDIGTSDGLQRADLIKEQTRKPRLHHVTDDKAGGPRYEIRDYVTTQSTYLDITGMVLTFHCNDGQCGKDATALSPEAINLMPALERINPGAELHSNLSKLPVDGLPNPLASRVQLAGGTLTAVESPKTGLQKKWWFGDDIHLKLSEDCVYSLETAAKDVSVVLTNSNGPINLPLKRDNLDNFHLHLRADHFGSSDDKVANPAQLHHGVLFLVESADFNKLLKTGGIPIPNAYWPDYSHYLKTKLHTDTDPNGGPCWLARVKPH
jgi:hypothetical protein